MWFGNDLFYKCPNCESLLWNPSLLSGNNGGLIAYSDSKIITPMNPEFPSISKCNNCNTIFWLSNSKTLEQLNPADNENWEYSERAEFLSIYDYFLALDFQIIKSIEEEIYIRERILWGFNDRTRNNEELFREDRDKILWLCNINRLIEILDINNIDHKTLLVELYRNLGDFKKSIELVNCFDDENFSEFKSAILKECINENTKVVLIY